MKKINNKSLTLIFLVVELVLYYFILTAGGNLLVGCSFGAILLCFLYTVTDFKNSNSYIICGLGFTVIADLFLVLWQPQQQLWGMFFFLIAQSIYAAMLQKRSNNKALLYTRIALIIFAVIITPVVLKAGTDLLAMVSMCYYANLIANIIESLYIFNSDRLFALGLILFILCDTVIGLQVASGEYLAIVENSLIYKIIFMDFNLSWFFYLPSQVLIALSSKITRSN